MSLGGSFGNQAYVCSICGHTMSLYAPHCPSCLNNSLKRVDNQKAPVGNPTTVQDRRQVEEPQSGPSLSFITVAFVVVLGVGAYSMFFAHRPDFASTRDSEPDAKSHAISVPGSNNQPIRHIKRFVAHSAAQAPRTHSAPSSISSSANATAPRRGAPMKLWEADKE